jgi:glyoxylase-like metal-dependent hydrolase (beta-lactamase superfamily II)
MDKLRLNRREALLAGGGLPLLLALPAAAQTAPEAVTPAFAGMAHGIRLGGFDLTTLLVGAGNSANPIATYGLNADPAQFEAVSRANFVPSDRTGGSFTPTLLRSGDALVLFDTGLVAADTVNALSLAGVKPDDVTHVVLTHMHGDHIGGLMDGETPVFANAELIAARAEADYWAANPGEAYNAKVKPLIGRARLFDGDDEILPGIRAEATHGHTPGHTTYLLESEGAKLLLTGDSFNHHVYSVERPEWHVRFDVDKEAGAATRKRVLARLANEMIPFVGYHMPFPALGFIAPNSAGTYRYVPASYQFG